MKPGRFLVVVRLEDCGPAAAEQFAEKVDFLCPAPKGAPDFERLAASLKRCPDTSPSFFGFRDIEINSLLSTIFPPPSFMPRDALVIRSRAQDRQH
jgi:hypothetical protein